MDPVDEANALLREKGYDERDLAVHAGPHGKALLKGNKIVSPFSDESELVLRVVRELVPTDAELGNRHIRPADLRARLAG
jgi:hypothetical protein